MQEPIISFPSFEELPERFKLHETIAQEHYLVNGEYRKWNGAFHDVYSPVRLQEGDKLVKYKLGHYPLLEEKQSLEALGAAREAYDLGRGSWPTMTVNERIAHVEHFKEEMSKRREEVVKLLMLEIGKTTGDAEKEFDRTVDYITDTIAALKQLDRDSSKLEHSGGVFAQIRRGPLGVVLCMGPYNYPLNETFTLLLPALLMGNTVIFKPAKFGVLLISPLLEAFKNCFPAGVINVIFGSGRVTASTLMETGKIDVLAFIGSSSGANALKKLHPNQNRLRSVLGLEAKNPGIVLPDANIELSVQECLLGSLSYNGQRCTALKVLFVHEKIKDEFMELFISSLNKLKAGMPWEDGVKLTPLPEDDKPNYLNGLIKDAISKGATLVNETGGETIGSYFNPAVLTGVDSSMKIFHEEQFGPVIPIVFFDNIEQPIRYIVESNYGQQVSIFSSNPEDISSLVDPLVNQVCRVNINSQCQRGPDNYPFNGRKDSAEGTLSVFDALRAFSIRTLVATKDSSQNKELLNQILQGRKSKFLSTDYIL